MGVRLQSAHLQCMWSATPDELMTTHQLVHKLLDTPMLLWPSVLVCVHVVHKPHQLHPIVLLRCDKAIIGMTASITGTVNAILAVESWLSEQGVHLTRPESASRDMNRTQCVHEGMKNCQGRAATFHRAMRSDWVRPLICSGVKVMWLLGSTVSTVASCMPVSSRAHASGQSGFTSTACTAHSDCNTRE